MTHWAHSNQEKTRVAVLITGARNHSAVNYTELKLTELQRDINKPKIRVSNFNNSQSSMAQAERKSASMEKIDSTSLTL